MEAGVSSNLQNAVSTACTIFATQFSCQKKKKKKREGGECETFSQLSSHQKALRGEIPETAIAL